MENFKTEVKSLKPLGFCIQNPKLAIYSTTITESPHVVLEIARKRKESFKSAGVHIKSDLDLDDYDVSGQQQSQMFIWDTEQQAIVGGYRYSYNNNIPPANSPMGKKFTFTDKFTQENWIHLGRSFLSVEYQKTRYGMISLMEGLGCIFTKANNPIGFFGKVTVPALYQENGATDFLVAFCKHYWINVDSLGSVHKDHEYKVSDIADFAMRHMNLKGDYKEVTAFLRQKYERPGLPILRMYDSLAQSFSSIHFLGAFVHEDFGGSTEIGMALAKENFSETARAYIEPYMRKE